MKRRRSRRRPARPNPSTGTYVAIGVAGVLAFAAYRFVTSLRPTRDGTLLT